MSQTPSKAPSRTRGGALSFLSLFTSLGTLLCCALPSLLVLFGLGATVATVLSDVPWLVALSHHKHWVFIVVGLMITGNFLYVYAIAPKLQIRNGACDSNDPGACQTASRFSRIVLWCSAGLYLVGFFTAYILGRLLVRFDS
jgi:mercuric ion transport protein